MENLKNKNFAECTKEIRWYVYLKAGKESEEKILWERQQRTHHRIRKLDFP